jgi:hypothetical protein
LASADSAALVFRHKPKEVVTSTAVRRVLGSIGKLEESYKVAVGRNFTREAVDLLVAEGYRVPTWQRSPKSNSSIVSHFPEPVRYSRTDCPSRWQIETWETANNLLGYLDPERRHYAVFSLPDDSYVQCLGSKKSLTVEARVYRPGGAFTHWVFGKGPLCGQDTRVGSRLGMITVDESQVLQMRDARVIIRHFLETRRFPDCYSRQDVTARFTGSDLPASLS